MDYAVVTSLLGIVEQLQQPSHLTCFILPEYADSQIIILRSLSHKLRFIQGYLQGSGPLQEQKLLSEGIIRVAVEAEDKIESKISDVYLAAEKLQGDHDASVEAACEDLHHTLQQVVKDIESVEERIRDLQIIRRTSLDDDDDVISSSTPSSSSSQFHIRDGGSSTIYLESENVFIGLEDGFEEIKGRLIHGYNGREVISIVGMGGAGKTTLARKVYEDPSVSSLFDIRAWTTVSQEFSRRQVLISLLRCIVSLTTGISRRDDRELAELLRRSLTNLRYLIVIDDIWSRRVWDDISRCFPNNDTGSRVLITTRIEHVAQYASLLLGAYRIRFLDQVESWNLFVRKVFKSGVCPLPELEPIGRKIVEKCGGLPLTIVVIAGILVKLGMSPEQWESFAQNINSTLMGVSEVLAFSYNNLPGYLRTCFLYLAIFPEDTDIYVKKLMNLWVAEGFLEPKKGTSLEEVAMDCLDDLISRNLVLVGKKSFDGEVKSCRLHDLMRNFCLRKAQEENMLVVSDDYRNDLVGTEEQSSKPAGCRWMSCQSHRWPITPSTSLNYNWGKIRSILYFGKDLYLRKCSFIFPCLKLLRVLDLSLIKYWDGMPSEIVNLIHLRYLALTTTGSLSNIQLLKLQNLQTLILFSWKEECYLQLQCEILDLPWLRHVRLDKGSSLYLPNMVRENLQTLFWLKVSSWDDSKPLDFTRVPNLKELGIYIEGEMLTDALEGLAMLSNLEKLKFEMGRVEHFSLPISFPPNIKKLTLCNTYLPWEKMDVIAMLPNLTVLKLKDFAFYGTNWEPIDSGFWQLKFLLIAHSDLEHWEANADHFPVLECLVLRCCWYLERLPYAFAESLNLQLIELIDCSPSLVMSAKKIQEEMCEVGKEDLVVRHSLTEAKG